MSELVSSVNDALKSHLRNSREDQGEISGLCDVLKLLLCLILLPYWVSQVRFFGVEEAEEDFPCVTIEPVPMGAFMVERQSLPTEVY